VDSTGALELATEPKRMLILGGGIIGLEMGTVYSTLGARLDVVEMLDGLMQGADRDLVRVWQKMNTPRFDNIMLKTRTVGAEATKDGILVRFEGAQAPKEPQLYDLVLVIPSVAYTDPEIAWVGLTEDQAKAEGIAIKKGHFPWTASGRAIANTRDEGFTKLLFDASTHRIVGGGIVGTHAGDMIGEVALAIEMGADEIDIGKTIHPHPTLGESIGMAAEIAHGTCTDVPPQRK